MIQDLPIVQETLQTLRHKDVKSTTLDRLRVSSQINNYLKNKIHFPSKRAKIFSILKILDPYDQKRVWHSQPLKLGYGLRYILGNIEVPIKKYDLLLGRISEKLLNRSEELFFKKTIIKLRGVRPSWMREGGHVTFGWQSLLQKGIKGLEKIGHEQILLRNAKNAPKEEIEFLKGMLLIYESFRIYIKRYENAARQMGKIKLAEACNNIENGAPTTFLEALQIIQIIGHVFSTHIAFNSTLTFGRMDELLLPYYLADLKEHRLTREEAGDLLTDFFSKTSIILGRGEHQMSGHSKFNTGWYRNLSYDSPLYIILGGQRNNSSSSVNDLTKLFIERIIPRYENPVFVVRYTPDFPEDVWLILCEKIRENASILIYNDNQVIPAMINAGIEKSDAIGYSMFGCNWPDIPGISRPSGNILIRLGKSILDVLTSEDLNLQKIGSMDEIYNEIYKQISLKTEAVCKDFIQIRKKKRSTAPKLLRVEDCFMENPINLARSAKDMGIKYPTITGQIVGTGTGADSLAAIEELVFKKGIITLPDFVEKLKHNFSKDEILRQRCLNAPKFGQDDDSADKHAVRLLNMVSEIFRNNSRLDSNDPIYIMRCMTSDMNHIRWGKEIGATPDGRSAKMPISENTSPSVGSSTQGLTAMFNSLAKLPFNQINSGALNVKINPSIIKGEEGKKTLGNLIRTYFEMGGMQTQFSIIDIATLKAAQKTPENYRDLMVRITGYSAVFVDMAQSAQNEIIRREEMS
jgi:pyruvate-formate lyase